MDIGLDHHIADVCKVIEDNQLSEVVLVGHSYGALVISGVAKKLANKIHSLLYLDAPIPEDNTSLLDILGPDQAQIFYNSAKIGDGWRVDSFPAAAFGLINKADIAWALPQHTAQSLKCFTDKVAVLTSDEAPHLKIGYIQCTPGNAFTDAQFKLAREKGWCQYQIEAPHSPMITHPEQFIELLCNQIIPEMSPGDY